MNENARDVFDRSNTYVNLSFLPLHFIGVYIDACTHIHVCICICISRHDFTEIRVNSLFLPADEDSDDDEPEEVTQAWEDLMYLQKEQQRYTEMREKVEQEMNEVKKRAKEMEEVRPGAEVI